MRDDLDDPLDELFGGSTLAAPRLMARPELADIAKPSFVENCRKCGGTGRYRHFGPCFACKGKGKFEFKTSPQARAENRVKTAARAVAKAQNSFEAFKSAHQAEAEWIVANTARGFEFAVNMRAAIERYGDLTTNQLAAVQRLVAREVARSVERETRAANAVTVDASKIEQAFTFARDRAARPGMKGIWTRPMPLTSTETTGKQTVVFQVSKPGGKWDGHVFVETNDGRKLGMVKGGKFIRKFGCTDADEAAVLDCASDPATAARAYGKAWGVCCVCSRTLTNDGSIERGIGPICAGRFGW